MGKLPSANAHTVPPCKQNAKKTCTEPSTAAAPLTINSANMASSSGQEQHFEVGMPSSAELVKEIAVVCISECPNIPIQIGYCYFTTARNVALPSIAESGWEYS